MNILKFLQLDFLPRCSNCGLFILRLWLGLSLLLLHGREKILKFSEMAGGFPNPFGLGSEISLGLAIFAEVVCAALIVVGAFTRLAAAVLVIQMATAFLLVHKLALSGPHSGELAFIYLGGFLVLLVAGAGRRSIDALLGSD